MKTTLALNYPERRSPFRRNEVRLQWRVAFDRVSAMPADQVDRLENKLVELRSGVGVTVPQMQLLRAIAARRFVQQMRSWHWRARA